MRPIDWYKTATIEDIVEGITWYDRAYFLALELSEATSYTLEQCAGVIAATSIRQRWETNVQWAKDALINGVLNGTSLVKKKVKAILECKGCKEKILTILNGPKISNFFLNILGDKSVVTVDLWMARAFGIPPEKVKGKRYNKLAAKIKELATKCGEHPAHFQAIIWVNIRKNWNNG